MDAILPIIIIVESFTAGIIYLFTAKFGSAVYWFAAGTINLSALYLIKRFG